MISTRPEQPEDVAAVRAINETAFDSSAEASIVDTLRTACPEALSLVAVEDGQVLGHVFFSPCIISGVNGETHGMGLAPMAVRTDRQRQGIGAMLVEAGIEAMRTRGCPFVIVLGHPEYYPRFGFVPASQRGISCPWDDVPDAAFLVLVLDEAAMTDVTGTARYRNEFDQAM